MYKEHLTLPQDPEFTLRVLLYEIGNISKLMIYRELFGPSGYLGDLRTELADARAMIGLLSEQLGHSDHGNLGFEGLERFQKRQQEKLEAYNKKRQEKMELHAESLTHCLWGFWVWGDWVYGKGNGKEAERPRGREGT